MLRGACAHTYVARCPGLLPLRTASGQRRSHGSVAAAQSQGTPASAGIQPQKVRDQAAVRDYLAAQPHLLERLGAATAADLTIEELGTGLINHVFKVSGDARKAATSAPASVLLKYAPPYVKTSGLKLAQVRMRVEADAMRTARAACTEHVPELIAYDMDHSVLVMEYIHHPELKVLEGLHTYGLTYPHLAQQVASLLVAVMAQTREETLGAEAFNRNVTEVFANTQIRALNEQVVLTDPMNANYRPNYKPRSAEVARAIQAFREDAVVQAALEETVRTYREDKQTLIHNDLHFGNLLACPHSLHCIDWEFATYGPMSFDIGCLMAVQLLAALTLGASSHAPAAPLPFTDTYAEDTQAVNRRAQQHWLLSSIEETWREFEAECNRHGIKPRRGSWAACYGDVMGFASFCVFRLTAGIHPYVGFKLVADERQADECRVKAVSLARALLHARAQVTPETAMTLIRRYV